MFAHIYRKVDCNSKNILVLVFVVMMPLVFATGADSHQEEAGLSHEFEEILPFHHFTEGHIFAGTVLILFWASFFYLLYSLFRIMSKKKRK